MSEEKVDVDELRYNKFINRIATCYTVEKQMDEVEKECEKLGVDVRDTFHVVGTKKEGDKRVLYIVTSGEKGKESARQIMREVGEADEITVENVSAKRYDDAVDEKLIDEMIREKQERMKRRM